MGPKATQDGLEFDLQKKERNGTLQRVQTLETYEPRGSGWMVSLSLLHAFWLGLVDLVNMVLVLVLDMAWYLCWKLWLGLGFRVYLFVYKFGLGWHGLG